ncbi:MAG: CDP-diacylglycerol diphosphatase [Sphingomonas sp.]|uniref:CDP-diacylglycerol diphosphatase n=1 Tax=Sphingomonas sp. TaxID=28214 RepID=UPI003F7F8C0D
MRTSVLGRLAALAGYALLAGCATPMAAPRAAVVVPNAPALPPPPVHPNGQVLWSIVNGKCVPDQQANAKPDPCTEVAIGNGVDHGYVVLKDRVGASQYLVMPTRLITGIEDPQLLASGATNYFDPAWRVRRLVDQRLGTTLTRDDIGVAVNSIYGRSQDLLHLHVDCLRIDVRDALHARLAAVGRHWSAPIALAGHGYYALRLDGNDSVATDPFVALAQGLRVPPGEMGAWTLVLAGATFSDGPGFVLLAARADPAAGYDGSGEDLQNHACAGHGASG